MMRALATAGIVAWLLCCGVAGPAFGQGEPVARGGVATYPPFEVNIEDGGVFSRLRLGFEAQFTDESGAKAAVAAQTRESLMLYLRGKTAAELLAPKGRDRLRAEVLAHLNAAIGSPKAVKLFFTDYLVIKGTP